MRQFFNGRVASYSTCFISSDSLNLFSLNKASFAPRNLAFSSRKVLYSACSLLYLISNSTCRLSHSSTINLRRRDFRKWYIAIVRKIKNGRYLNSVALHVYGIIGAIITHTMPITIPQIVSRSLLSNGFIYFFTPSVPTLHVKPVLPIY